MQVICYDVIQCDMTRHDAIQYNKYRVAFVASLGNPVSFTLHFLEPDDSKEKKEDDIKED